MPWRQSNFKHEDGTYESKYKEVKNGIVQNVKGHECNLDIDCEEQDSFNFLNLDDCSDNEKFSLNDPRLINFEEERHVHVSSSPISAMSVVDTQGNVLQNVHSPK